jgi:hypothetical protein
MSFAVRFASLLALVAPICIPAHAENAPVLGIDYEVGTSLVCDTQGQVERFVALYSGDMKDTIKLVNAEEHDPTACALANVAFVRGTEFGTARHGDDAFQVVHILIVGVSTDNGVQAVRPAAYYSLFRIKEFAV